MIILDENIIENQCQLLRSWRIQYRQIGYTTGKQGLKDKEIISLLHSMQRPTFFTRDDDFFKPNLCHAKYSIVYLAIKKDEAGNFIRRLLRHKEFNTTTKRMGKVVRVSHSGLSVWRLHIENQIRLNW
jgi:hypothetical protein